jgi:peptide/nickel transport system permease protein
VVLSLRERQYVRAAKAAGAGPFWIMRFHIMPGVVGITLLYGVFGAAWSILTEATLSFIGLADAASISWGLMLNQAFASGAIRFAWWWVLPPGISLALLLGALFLLARSIEGAVDRRLAD